MIDLRLHLVDFLAQIRGTNRSSANTLSGMALLIIAVGLAAGLLWLTPIAVSRDLTLVLLYSVSLMELLLGLRVGFLRIGQRDDEYFLPTALRYWRRSISYVLPAVLLPLPIAIAVAQGLGSGRVGEWLVFAAVLTNYVMFFAIGTAWTAIIRKISRQTIARLAILLLSVIAVVTLLDTGDFIYRAVLLFQKQGNESLLWVIFGQISVTAVAIALVDLAISNITLTTKKVSRYWPIFLVATPLGFGQGSSAFFTTNRFLIRNSAVHRRLIALLIGAVLFVVISYITLALGGLIVGSVLPLIVLAIFGAGSAYVISTQTTALLRKRVESNGHLPIEKEKVVAGAWVASAFWQLMMVFIGWGLITSWLGIATVYLWPLFISAIIQQTLIFGWSTKLERANHHTVASLAVFLMAVLVGALPLILIPLSGLGITLLIQLIWLVFVVILLQITKTERVVIQYG